MGGTRLRGYLKVGIDIDQGSIITASGPLDAEQTPRYESFRYSLGAGGSAVATSAAGWTTAHRFPCSRQCGLLSTPDGLPMATASGRIPAWGTVYHYLRTWKNMGVDLPTA
jgi:hypothetical protein